MAAPYAVPIATSPTIGGNQLILSQPSAGINYDVGQEYPLDPYRLCIAWANGYWRMTGFYNGK